MSWVVMVTEDLTQALPGPHPALLLAGVGRTFMQKSTPLLCSLRAFRLPFLAQCSRPPCLRAGLGRCGTPALFVLPAHSSDGCHHSAGSLSSLGRVRGSAPGGFLDVWEAIRLGDVALISVDEVQIHVDTLLSYLEQRLLTCFPSLQ